MCIHRMGEKTIKSDNVFNFELLYPVIENKVLGGAWDKHFAYFERDIIIVI